VSVGKLRLRFRLVQARRRIQSKGTELLKSAEPRISAAPVAPHHPPHARPAIQAAGNAEK